MARTARGREVLAGIPSRRRTQELQALLQGPLGPAGQHLDLPPGGPAHGRDGNPPARARRLDRRARAPRINVTAPARAPGRLRPGHSPCLSARVVRLLHACRAPAHGRLRSRPVQRPPGRRIHALLRRRTCRVVAGGSSSGRTPTRWPAARGATQLARRQPRARFRSHRLQRDMPARPASAGPTATTYEIAHTGDWRMARGRRYCGAWEDRCGVLALGSRAPSILSARNDRDPDGLSGDRGTDWTLRDASVPAEPHPIATLIA